MWSFQGYRLPCRLVAVNFAPAAYTLGAMVGVSNEIKMDSNSAAGVSATLRACLESRDCGQLRPCAQGFAASIRAFSA